MAGLHGHIQTACSVPTAHIAQSFSDVLGNLDAAAFLNGTARKGLYVLLADTSYASVSDTARLPLGLKAQAKVQQTSLTISAGYNWQLSPHDSVDALAGVRWWNIRSQVQVPPLLTARIHASFADPIVALRWRHQLDKRWSTLLYTDVGGFGAGSEFTWQLLALVNYQVRDNLFLSAGYRQLNVDYRHHVQRLNLRMSGPVLGATLRF